MKRPGFVAWLIDGQAQAERHRRENAEREARAEQHRRETGRGRASWRRFAILRR